MGFRKAALIERKPALERRVATRAASERPPVAQVDDLRAPPDVVSLAAAAPKRPVFPRYSNRAGAALVQAKLAVAAAGDAYEQDADRAADQWLRSSKGPIRVRALTPGAWRDGAPVPPEISRRIEWMRGQGSPLPPAVRRQFESRMQRSLSGVRIHTSSEAAELAAMLDARAFTSGKDVFFAAGEWQPHTQPGQRLLAHELAHTVQQSQSVAGPGVQREEKSRWQRFKDWASEKASQGVSLVGDAAMYIVRGVAPELAKIIEQGPLEYIKGHLSKAIEGWIPDLLQGFSIESMLAKVRAGVSGIIAKLDGLRHPSAEACKNFATTLGTIRDFIIDVIDNPVFEFFRTNLEKFQATVVKIGAFVLAPVFDFFRDAAVSTWNAIKKVAGWIWSGIKAVKDVAGEALDWVLKRLGIDTSDSGEEGVWGWIKQKANQVWTAIRETLAPVVAPLTTMIKIGLALTPLGPIYVLIRYGPQVVKSIEWLWSHRNDPNLIEKAHKEMGDTILPDILDAITNADGKLKEGVDWLTGKVEELAATVLDFLGKLTGLPLLGAARELAGKVSEGLQATVAWGRETLKKGAEFFRKVVADVTRIIQPYKEILSSLALAVINPTMIPVIIAGWAWRAIPKCFKIPIIDFVLGIVITAVSKAPELPMMGPLWPLLKSAVVAALEMFRKQDDDTKEAVSNKVAKIISGASPDFLLGFVKGFLTGVWETLTDPIKAIWSIIEGLNKLLELFDKWTGGGEKQEIHAVPKAASAAAGASPGGAMAAPTPAATAAAAPAPAAAPPVAAPAPAAGTPAPEQSAAPEGGEEAEEPAGGEVAQLGPEDQASIGERLGQMGKELQPPAQVVTGQFWSAAQEYFSASGGTSFPELVAKLGEAWEAVRKKIADESGKLAKKLIDYLISDVADGEIGDKLGWLTGMVATQLLLDYLTAGTTEVLKPLQVVAKFLNWPMELMGKAFKLIGKLGKYVVQWIKKLGGMVKDAAAGAFLAVKDALGLIGSKLVQFAEEIIGRFAKFAGKRGGAVLREGEKLGESGLTKAAAQEGKALAKTEQKALQPLEKSAAGEGGKAGQKVERQELKEGKKAADAEKEAKTAKEESERKAKEALEAPAVVAEARGIVRTGNAMHAPLPLILLELAPLKGLHSWIKYFEPVPEGIPGRFHVHMIATDYDLGEVGTLSPPEIKPGEKLNKNGLTSEQEKYYRDLIDHPPAGKTADQMRFERNQLSRKQRGLPDLPESKWEASKTQLSQNKKFGIEQENKAREGVKEFEKRPDLKNNNKGDVVQPTVKDPKTGKDVTTRPDSVGTKGEDKIDFVHDHKTATGSDKVVYDTDQLRAQKTLLSPDVKGKHCVSISTNKPNLAGIPPEPRPSGPLAQGRTIYFTNPEGKVTHQWVIDDLRKGGGYWKAVK